MNSLEKIESKILDEMAMWERMVKSTNSDTGFYYYSAYSKALSIVRKEMKDAAV